MAKLVDARALGARGAIHGGSSPLPGTKVSEANDVTGARRLHALRERNRKGRVYFLPS